MQHFLTSPLFFWARGKRERWEVSRGVVDGWPDTQISYAGHWPSNADPEANLYQPLNSPHIYEEFAEIGRIAREATTEVDEMMHSRSEVVGPMATARSHAALIVAFDNPDVTAAALRFTRNYGPLDLEDRGVVKPRATDDDGGIILQSFERSVSGRRFASLAAELAEAVRVAASGEAYPRWLNDVMNGHLRGVHPVSLGADELGTSFQRGAYTFTCDSLLAALWWQFYQADASGGAWLACKGCQRMFVQSRSDQEYHDKSCRNRTNVAKAGKKKRAAQKPKKRTRKPRRKGASS